jgi:thiol-disulfide isomerase/thioredoxin
MSPRGSVANALTPLDRASVWLNSEPLTAEALAGRVVLVDFWTYSCVNWLRTLPYVRAWAETYADRGLTVVGVHAPEFGFEHELDNVRRAVADLRCPYPVVIDNGFDIWRAFDNHYWPALYLPTAPAACRFHHFGEEAYAETEQAIQQLLGIDDELVPVEAGRGRRARRLGRPALPRDLRRPRPRHRPSARAPGELALNQWTLTGPWTIERSSPSPTRAAGSIAFRFEGRDLNLVLTPPAGGQAPASRCCSTAGRSGEDWRRSTSTGPARASSPSPACTSCPPARTRPAAHVRAAVPRAGARAYVFTFG